MQAELSLQREKALLQAGPPKWAQNLSQKQDFRQQGPCPEEGVERNEAETAETGANLVTDH